MPNGPLKRVSRSLPYMGAAAAGVAGLFVERIGSTRLLRSYQLARLRHLLRHSYETVPFYRERFQSAGFHPDQFRTLEDLERVPITRKSDLRVASEQDAIAVDCEPDRLHRYGTGGSTGTPTEVRFTPFEDRLLQLMRIQANMRFGLRMLDRRTLCVIRPKSRPGLLERLGIIHRQTIDSSSPWETLRADVRRFGPDVIRGYPSVLATLADKLTDEDRLYVRPRFITTDSENLSELARMRIEAGFRAPVFDIYDCWECNVIAYQCPRGKGYHVMDAALVVEVLNEDRPALPGESGEIVFTSLHAWAAPLIRYMPGDIVEQGPAKCGCGAVNSCLAGIIGRKHDRFLLPDGKSLYPKFLASWIYPLCPILRQYQIVQEAPDRIVVKLQPNSGVEVSPDMLETMRNGMERTLGKSVTLLVRLVDTIHCEPNGKFRPYKCYLDDAQAVG
jgi:phenylacetate-CoA ligase